MSTMSIKKKKRKKTGAFRADFSIILMVTILVTFGIVMVFSASYYNSINLYGNPFHYLIRETAWVIMGAAAMAVLSRLDYRVWRSFSVPLLGLSLLFLLLLFTPLGIERNNAVRWLGLGGLTFMPGEFAKLGVLVAVSAYFAEDPGRARRFSAGMLPVLALCAVFGGLIYKQPNMSTAIIVCGIALAILFFSGVRMSHFAGLVGLAAAGSLVLILGDPSGFRYRRFVSFLDPFADPLGEGYQVMQSLFALGSGGFGGVKLGQSIHKSLHLPEAQNDFILAIIGEELGFLGCLLLLILYLILIWKGFEVALNAPDRFGSLLAAGITSMLAMQVILNVAVVTSSMPATGVILPFVSYGGNALLLFMSCMGILLNISSKSRHPEREGDLPAGGAGGRKERNVL